MLYWKYFFYFPLFCQVWIDLFKEKWESIGSIWKQMSRTRRQQKALNLRKGEIIYLWLSVLVHASRVNSDLGPTVNTSSDHRRKKTRILFQLRLVKANFLICGLSSLLWEQGRGAGSNLQRGPPLLKNTDGPRGSILEIQLHSFQDSSSTRLTSRCFPSRGRRI